MAHSPESAAESARRDNYARGWEALGALLARGHSFSGRERNVVFLNLRGTGNGVRFADSSGALGLDQADDSRCVIPIDWDGDGDLDLWFGNRTAPRLRFFRNDMPPPKQWLGLRPVGRHANRDAIGLRATVVLKSPDGTTRAIWRTLRAGDSFLSQTPKVLMFAFAANESIDHIELRWPAPGKAQTLAGLDPNAVYRVTETEGPVAAVERFPVEPAPRLRGPEVPPDTEPPHPGVERARLLERMELPATDYYSLDGSKHSLGDRLKDPAATGVLVLAQASWCAACRAEMKAFIERAPDLREAGLRVLALSVDAAHAGATKEDVAAAQRYFAGLKWTFESGLAHEGTMRALAGVNAKALYPERGLRLPSAWLVDAAGRVAVIYTGPPTVDGLLADARGLNDPPSPAWAFPFRGRSARNYFRLSGAGIGQAWLQAGEPALAREELLQARAALEPMQVSSPAARASLVEVHGLLGEAEWATGQSAEAIESWRAGLALLPPGHAARLRWAAKLQMAGAVEAATAELASLVTTAHESANNDLKIELARHFRESGDAPRALRILATVASPHASAKPTLFERALSRQAAGDLAGAIADNESLMGMGVPEAGYNLAWILATARKPDLRDPKRALALTADVESHPSASLLDTRAAALAANGRYDEALATARRALAAARAEGDPATATAILQHWHTWQKGEQVSP